MMIRFLPLPLLLLAAACDRQQDDAAQQPGVVTNIVDQALPQTRPADAPANAIAPADPAPGVDAPPPPPAPDGLIPVGFQGRWTGEAERCGDRAAAFALTVAPDKLVFHESVGTVKAVRDGADGRIAVDASFTGEGQSWQRTVEMRRNGERLVVTNDGAAVTRKRC